MNPDANAALTALRASSSDLLADLSVQAWSDAEVSAPALLPGWTRGHVLTHLARNADGINRTLSGALLGQQVARYPTGDVGRNLDIEAGAGRPMSALLADLTDAIERLDRVFGAVADAGAWDRPTDKGRPAHKWLRSRLHEVEIHRVDLDAGYSPAQWPAPLVVELLPHLAAGLGERTDEAVRVEITGDGSTAPDHVGRTWSSGSNGSSGVGEQVLVRGPDWAVLAWLVGRPSAAQGHLSSAPALLPW